MNKPMDIANQAPEPMTFGPEAFVSERYARAEGDKLWRKVWLQAGRVEEIPGVGDFITFDILESSVIILRNAEGVRAFHNVCSHRGRRLVDTPPGARNARGKADQFVCGFHAWRYGLDGRCSFALDKEDWNGALTEERTRLGEVKVDCWGGWLWINLDPGCQPLRDYLEPAASLLDPFQLERMRYRWRRWLVFDCNWKIAMEAFSETYHLPGTHPQVMKFASYRSWSRAQGDHSHIGYQPAGDIETTNTKVRVGKGDARLSTAEMHAYLLKAVNAITTQTLTAAAQRLASEVPEGTPPEKVVEHWLRSAREYDASRGVVWPVVSPEQVARAGNAWQIFPNVQIGHAPTHALCYAARPHSYDPTKCIFETAVLELYPQGGEPQTDWIYTSAEEEETWGEIPPQDFSNMAALQRGVADPAFRGLLPNPLQENSITHLHRTLAKYMGEGEPQPLG